MRFGVDAGALDRGAGVAHDLEHRDVLGQRMDDDRVDAAIARAQHGVVEQARTVAASPPAHGHRHAELGGAGAIRIGVHRGLVGQVGEGDEVEAAVEHAEDLVALERDAFHVAADLVVGRGIAEAQVAVVHVQRQQVRQDARAVAFGQRADRHPAERAQRCRQRGRNRFRAEAVGAGVVLRNLGRGVAGMAHDELPECLPEKNECTRNARVESAGMLRCSTPFPGFASDRTGRRGREAGVERGLWPDPGEPV